MEKLRVIKNLDESRDSTKYYIVLEKDVKKFNLCKTVQGTLLEKNNKIAVEILKEYLDDGVNELKKRKFRFFGTLDNEVFIVCQVGMFLA